METPGQPPQGNPSSFVQEMQNVMSGPASPTPAAPAIPASPAPAPQAVTPGQSAPQQSIPQPPEVQFTQGDIRETESPGEFEQFVKVDGVGRWLPCKEVADGYSFKRHNTQEAQRLADERRNLETERLRLLSNPNPAPPVPAALPGQDDLRGLFGIPDPGPTAQEFLDDPAKATDRMLEHKLQPILQVVQNLSQSDAARNAVTAKERGIENLANVLPGFNRQLVESEMARMDANEAKRYDSPAGYEAVHWKLVAAGLVSAPQAANASVPAPPAAERSSGPVRPVQGQRPTGKIKSVDQIATYLDGLRSFQ